MYSPNLCEVCGAISCAILNSSRVILSDLRASSINEIIVSSSCLYKLPSIRNTVPWFCIRCELEFNLLNLLNAMMNAKALIFVSLNYVYFQTLHISQLSTDRWEIVDVRNDEAKLKDFNSVNVTSQLLVYANLHFCREFWQTVFDLFVHEKAS